MDGGNLFGQEQKKRPKISHSSIECYFDTSIEFRHSAFFIINCNNNIKIQEYKTILCFKNGDKKREKN